MVRSVDVAQHPGWLFTQEQIYEAVWHEFPEDCGAAVVNIISQLRRKMGPGNPIRTVPHSGYKFDCLLRIRCAGKSKFNNLCRLIAIYLKENEQRVRACKYHLFLLSCQCEQIGIAVIPAVPIPMSRAIVSLE